jgi:hypothetical protein
MGLLGDMGLLVAFYMALKLARLLYIDAMENPAGASVHRATN